MTNTMIEKLEALRASMHDDNYESFLGKERECELIDEIIKQAKAEQAEPVAWLKEWQYDMQDMKRIDFHETCEAWLNALNVKVTPLYTAPQPTPQSEPVELKKLAQDFWDAADCLRTRRTNKALADRFVGYYCDVVHKRIAPQPTPQDVIDAELGKLVRQKMQSGNNIPVSRCVITREEFDKAMKGKL